MEDGFVFALYKSEIRQFNLYEDGILDEELYYNNIVPLLRTRIKKRLLHILVVRDISEADLRNKLTNDYPGELIDEAVFWAKKNHYIDDGEYARNYIEARKDKYSKKKLKYKLMEKGIRKEIIDRVLEYTDIDERKLIIEELDKKTILYRELNYDKQQKIIASLLRKGYEYKLIQEVLEERFDD